jgi:hypothetical protein
MNIHGRCHCGQISFTALVNPQRVVACHCTDCQTFSGGPFRASVAVAADQVQLQGQPTEYVKTAASGNQRVQGFCGTCGTHLYATALNDRSTLGLRLGCVVERDQLPPVAQVWGQSAMPWLGELADTPCHMQGPASPLRA